MKVRLLPRSWLQLDGLENVDDYDSWKTFSRWSEIRLVLGRNLSPRHYPVGKGFGNSSTRPISQRDRALSILQPLTPRCNVVHAINHL